MSSTKPKPSREGGVDDFNAALEARAARRQVSNLPTLRKEADALVRRLADGSWWTEPTSGNTFQIAAAARGDVQSIAALCEGELEHGLGNLEHGSPGFYYSGVMVAKMVALRDARDRGMVAAEKSICRILRANLAWDALVAIPAGRLRDRVLLGGEWTEVASPNLADGLSVAVAGNRWHDILDDAHAAVLAHALDYQPRASRAPRKLRGALGELLREHGATQYSHRAPAAAWGITEAERSLLRKVTAEASAEAAGEVAGWIPGVRRARGTTPPWRWRLRRTSAGAESVFLGSSEPGGSDGFPNPNKPARECSQALREDGTHVGLQASSRNDNPPASAGWRVELRDGAIWSRSDQCPEWHSIPELGGGLLWEVDVRGGAVVFRAGGRG